MTITNSELVLVHPRFRNDLQSCFLPLLCEYWRTLHQVFVEQKLRLLANLQISVFSLALLPFSNFPLHGSMFAFQIFCDKSVALHFCSASFLISCLSFRFFSPSFNFCFFSNFSLSSRIFSRSSFSS